MTVSLLELVKDWLETNHWNVLEVKSANSSGGNRIQPKGWPQDKDALSYMNNPFVSIYDNKVGHISAADPEFFEKLDQYLVRKYFNQSAWHQAKTNHKKPRQQIWP